MNLRFVLPPLAAVVAASLTSTLAHAVTGVCDSAPLANPTSMQLCTQQIQSSVGIVNDIFHDANGKDAQNLPVYGKLINNWPGCPERVDFAGAGHSIPPYDCPSQYVGDSTTPTVANANNFLGAVDRYWWQPCRLADPTLQDIGGGTMCVANWACIADGTGGNYYPWTGLVFDLGGPSNKVAIFAENDHGPQPCESFEYTVYLTDNPYAHDMTDIISDPSTQGVDPMKWNRAVLSKLYTQGWTIARQGYDPNNPGAVAKPQCGDTAEYYVEEDSFVQVFSLPCGITFRYAAVIAGNDGHDFPLCGYDSSEGEIDAVAGLTENGSAVCPDADGDHYVDCNCPGHPPVCDCNDSDPNVHPGAPEACDATSDLNCDGTLGTPCPANLFCNNSICIPQCGGGENPYCPAGSTCQTTPNGKLCVPKDCGCKPGEVCVNDQCVDACKDVTCPGSQVCQDGACVDPCANLQCPQGQQCQGGQCVSPCNCFAGDIGCTGGLVCDSGSSNTCVPPPCKGVSCPAGQTCDATSGTCVSFCNGNVHCPQGEKCVDPDGCVPVCQGVQCPTNFACDPMTGQCVDMSCANVTCFPPQVCMGGVCVAPDGGAGGQGGAGGGGGATSSSSGNPETSTSSSGAPGAKGKCGCRIVGEPDEGPLSIAGALGVLGLVAAGLRRRRR
jgi:MYXO-CTERM domain-containing protein